MVKKMDWFKLEGFSSELVILEACRESGVGKFVDTILFQIILSAFLYPKFYKQVLWVLLF